VALQAALRPYAFQQVTLPFLRGILDLDVRVLSFLGGVLFIDTVSIYQTMLFLRIARGCRNVGEFLFISFADVVMSFLIFIFLIPLFVTIPFLSSSPRERTLDFVLTSEAVKQDADVLSSLRAVPGSLDSRS
jgi:hypothetical protein